MEKEELDKIKTGFYDYVKNFYSEDEEINANIKLKEEHTTRVCTRMNELTNSLNLPPKKKYLAQAIAILHDIGRFAQYKKYRTFRDSLSEDHGELGLKVLAENKFLENIKAREKASIKKAIQYHNKIEIPEGLDDEELLFCRLIRDADKLDIWYVVTKYYAEKPEQSKVAIGKGLDFAQSYTPEVYYAFLTQGGILYSAIKTHDDLKLLQLSWIFDLYFKYSLQYLLEQDYHNTILNLLPLSPQTEKIKHKVYTYLEMGI